MMNLLVCFKGTPDLDSLTESDWRPDQSFRVETRYARTIINPLDESALELALMLRDQAAALGVTVELSAVTIGNDLADPILKRLYALKFDRALRLEATEAPAFDPGGVSAALAGVVGQSPEIDVVLMGGRSADGDNALTSFWLAERLGWPCTAETIGLTPLPDGNLSLTRQSDDGLIRETLKPPIVVSIGNAPSTYLRVPTLKDKMSHGKREIELKPLESLAGVTNTPTAYGLTALSYEEPKRNTTVINGQDAAEKVRQLYDCYLKDLVES